MMIGRIQNATRVLGKPSHMSDEECGSLAIRDVRVGDYPAMMSAWFPTPAEVDAMMKGAPVYLTIFGTQHPPVSLTVGDGGL